MNIRQIEKTSHTGWMLFMMAFNNIFLMVFIFRLCLFWCITYNSFRPDFKLEKINKSTYNGFRPDFKLEKIDKSTYRQEESGETIIQLLVEKILNVVIFLSLYPVVLTPNISDSSRWLILNVAILAYGLF